MKKKFLKFGGASPQLATLLGARVAFLDESEIGGKINDAVIKNLTGNALITARPLYSNLITFEPTYQLFLLTNYKPEFIVSHSMERRIILIPFLAEFRNDSTFNANNKFHKKGNINIED